MSDSSEHFPVMKHEMLNALDPKESEIYIDGTLGAGGYTRAILAAADCSAIAIDQDPLAHKMAADWMQQYGDRLHLAVGNFSEMVELANNIGHQSIDGVVLDIGVSSMQFDQAERGFSFNKNAPLDMRMSQAGMSAADFLNEASEADIADVLYVYGEEHASRRVAKFIVEARAEKTITHTVQLRDIIHKAIGNKGKIDSATKSFQALRIHVNGELDALKAGLKAAEQLLKPEGRLIVVSFHSLEDRIVKQFMQVRSTPPAQHRHMPDIANDNFLPSFTLGKPRKLKASKEECAENPRSRSAVMRVAIRTEHPPMNMEAAA